MDNPYTSCLQAQIAVVAANFGYLFDSELAKKLFECRLFEDFNSALILSSRIISRKYDWLRSDSLLSYGLADDGLRSLDTMLKLLQALESASLVDLIGNSKNKHSFNQIWEAMETCLNRREWLNICKAMNLSQRVVNRR